jgi:hypothetical protein
MVPRKLILVLALLGLGATCLQADDQRQGAAEVSEFTVTGDIEGTYAFDMLTGGSVNEDERRLILTRIEDESFDGVTLNGTIPEGSGSVVTGEDFQLTLTFERTDFRSDNGECVLEFTDVAVVPVEAPSGEVIASRLEFVTDITCSGLQGGRGEDQKTIDVEGVVRWPMLAGRF